MPGAGALRLGAVARKLLSPDVWTHGYPGPEGHIKELDVLLQFADERGCLSPFLPNLEARNKQRDEAPNELCLAYWFDSLGFAVTQWDPPGLNGQIGEFLLDSPKKVPVFTEIKSPCGESELTSAQIKTGRALQAKYTDLGGGPSATGTLFTAALPHRKPIQNSLTSSRICASFRIISRCRFTIRSSRSKVRSMGAKSGMGRMDTTNGFENIGGLGVFTPSRRLIRAAWNVSSSCSKIPTRSNPRSSRSHSSNKDRLLTASREAQSRAVQGDCTR